MQRELTAARQNAQTNKDLRALLDLGGSLKVRTVGAQVIARDPEGLLPALTINIGSARGVKKGMVVLAQHGMVGRVVQVQQNSAQVDLVSDPQAPVNVMLATSHLTGTLHVSQERMLVDIPSAPVGLQVNPGEALVTSGIGGNYPKGLPVAQVVSYQYRAVSPVQQAQATPLDDLMRLEFLMVDLDFVPQLAP